MQNYNPYDPQFAAPMVPEQQYMPQYQPGYPAPAGYPQAYTPEPAPYAAPYGAAPAAFAAPYASPQPGYAPMPAYQTPSYVPEPSPYMANSYAQPQPMGYGQPAAQPFLQQPVVPQIQTGQFGGAAPAGGGYGSGYIQPQPQYAPQQPQPMQQPQAQGFPAASDPDGDVKNRIANTVAQMGSAAPAAPPQQQPQQPMGDGFGISPNAGDMMHGFDDLASQFFGSEQAAAPAPPYSMPAGSYREPIPAAPPQVTAPGASQIVDAAQTTHSPGYAAPPNYGYQPPQSEIDTIGNELEKALLRSDASKIYTENNLYVGPNDNYLAVEDATSEYEVGGGVEDALFSNISFNVSSSSCTAIVSDSPATRYALLYSVGTGRGLYDGEVDVLGVPILQRRDLRSQVLYIDSDGMIPGNMTAMEFMMQCAYKVDEWPAAKQQRFLRMLDDLGLSSNAMMNLKNMGSARRILYLLVATTMNSLVRCVVLNVQKMALDTEEIIKYRKVFSTLYNNGVAVLLGDFDAELTAALANRIVAIKGGRLAFSGSFRGFVERYCQQTMTFDMPSQEALTMLANRYPSHSFRASVSANSVSVTGDFSADTTESIVNSLSELGVDLGSVSLSEVSFRAAREELLRQ